MDIHKLRCIVSLANLRNVTRAAEKNYVAQSTMSSTISSVESELGIRLFIRNNKGVSLTTAGESFIVAAEEIVQRYDHAIVEARYLSEQQEVSFTIGFNSMSVGSEIGTIVKRFHVAYPQFNLRLCKHSLSELTDCLFDKRADLIYSNQFEMRKNPKCRFLPIAETYPCVYIPKGHPFSKRKEITVSDLEGEPLLCACIQGDPHRFSAAAEVLRNGGIPYTDESPVSNEETIAAMVEAGIGLYPASTWYKRAFIDKVDFVPLSIDVEPMQIVVAWTREDIDIMAKTLASISKNIYARALSCV